MWKAPEGGIGVSAHCLRAFLLRWEVTLPLQVRDQFGDVKKVVGGYC